MDINLLLSPQESPQESLLPNAKTSKKPRRSRKPVIASEPSQTFSSALPPLSLSYSAVGQTQHAVPSPPLRSPASHLRAYNLSTSPVDNSRTTKQPSTPGMDTLAELASMQHHQQTTRVNAGGLRSADIYESQPSSATILPNLHGKPKRRSSGQGSADLFSHDAEVRAPSQPHCPADSLSEAEYKSFVQLVDYLAKNPFAYNSHVQLIMLLHEGFISYMRRHASTSEDMAPHNYGLLEDLRNARETMNSMFALGEELWVDWIQDQKLLAQSLDDCITVIESCRKSVDEEPGSTSLWLLYAEWMLNLYQIANPLDPRIQSVEGSTSKFPRWSEEDLTVAREVCGWQQLMEVWAQGAQETKWRMNDSYQIWDRYTEILLQDLANTPTAERKTALNSHFLDRLQIPHASWDQTFQLYSNFISQYFSATYEETMVEANQKGYSAKNWYNLRESMETNLQKARGANEKDAEWRIFIDYIEWEISQSRKRHEFHFELAHALYQRATLRFPSDTNLWEGFIMFLNDQVITHAQRDIPLLPLLNRATSHCPWSGTLWSQYLLVAERDRRPFPDMIHIKHKATSTGLLDAGEMSEILAVHVAWCGFLRRRAFDQDSTEEDMDVAEVGILSAIEDMNTLGRMKYGEEFKGDPENRLERIYIRYLTQCHNWRSARDTWKGLISKQGDNCDFWLRYYLWEMGAWGKEVLTDSGGQASQVSRPTEATQVLRQALKRPSLDWPERILAIFQHHCECNEDVEELQSAFLHIWKTKGLLRKRREKEATEAVEAAQTQAPQQYLSAQHLSYSEGLEDKASVGKRKRENTDESTESSFHKKIRPDAADQIAANGESLSINSIHPKRDRENSTVIVKNLPSGTTEVQVRQLFRDCGTINSLKLLDNDDHGSTIATIEFDNHEDVLAARTKDMKEVDGHEISVQLGTESTLFVTNFPPTADEAFIRNLFAGFGEVIDVRFPSLKKNTHRRFCYVQFKTTNEAKAATDLDGKTLSEKLKLVVRISDPERRQDRSGAIYEGRELHVGNIHWDLNENDISEAFHQYGKVERIRIPKSTEGKSKGFAFIVFSTKDEAKAALAMDKKKLKNRPLAVSISAPNLVKRQATAVLKPPIRSSHSPSLSHLAPSENGLISPDNASSSRPPSPANAIIKPSSSEIQSRTIALLHVPDTVNDTRIRVLAEPYGSLTKVVLRPDHQGAIIEFSDIASAGKAALSLEGYEISPGRKLSVGSVPDMLKLKEEIKSNRVNGASSSKKLVYGTLPQTGPIKRPVKQGIRTGRRGGLGVRKGPVGLGEGKVADVTPEEEYGVSNSHEELRDKGKSNDDFRAMLVR